MVFWLETPLPPTAVNFPFFLLPMNRDKKNQKNQGQTKRSAGLAGPTHMNISETL
jgi:hypothetical protein